MLDQRPLQYVVHALVQTRLVGVFRPRSEFAEETYGLPNGLVYLFVGQGVEDAVTAQQNVIKVGSDAECRDLRFRCHYMRSAAKIAGFALDVAERPGNLVLHHFYRQTSGLDSPRTEDPLFGFLWDPVDLCEVRVCDCVINFGLHGHLVVADPVQLPTVLEDALHFPEELGFVVVGADRELLSPLAGQYCSGVADIHEQQLVIWVTENLPTTKSTSAQDPLVSQEWTSPARFKNSSSRSRHP